MLIEIVARIFISIMIMYLYGTKITTDTSGIVMMVLGIVMMLWVINPVKYKWKRVWEIASGIMIFMFMGSWLSHTAEPVGTHIFVFYFFLALGLVLIVGEKQINKYFANNKKKADRGRKNKKVRNRITK